MESNQQSKYLIGIAENSYAVLQEIYTKFSPKILAHIRQNSGSEADAKDIFQEAILIIFKKIKKGDLKLTTTFDNYLFGVCRLLWLKKLKKNSKEAVTFGDLGEYEIVEDIEAATIKSKKWALFQQKFQELGEDCRRVLKLFFNKKSGKEIAIAMNYSEEYAKRKKYKCKQKLAQLVKSDAAFKELTNN